MENKFERGRFFRGRKHRAGWIILGIIGFIGFAFLFGAVIMWLWNALMPVIFHLGIITYWQAFGLAILGRLLFGGFQHGHHGRTGRMGPWRRGMHMHGGRNCRDYSNGTKWSYYEQYWNDEGEKAFDEYVKRKSENPVKE